MMRVRRAADADAIRFYERAGFAPFTQRMALELDG